MNISDQFDHQIKGKKGNPNKGIKMFGLGNDNILDLYTSMLFYTYKIT